MSIDICYVFSNGFGARMILQSDVVAQLRVRGRSMAVVTPNAGEPSMRRLADRHGVRLEQAPAITGWRHAEYHKARRYLFEDVRNNPAIWARELESRAHPPRRPLKRLRHALYYPMNRASMRFPRFRHLLSRVEKRALASREVADLLTRINPAVAVATYPVDALDASFLFEAQRLGIHTVGHLMSWDNVTSKGRFSVLTDSYISWGPIMTGEIKEYYQVPDAAIHECGVAHFDVHARSRDARQHGRIMADLGLDPAKPYLFFGMTTPRFAPREIDIVEWLAGAVRRGAFGPDLQLVIRQHPQNVEGEPTLARRLEALAGDRVAIDYPALEASRLQWSLKEEDLPRLSCLIGGSAMGLNSCSTICIDAVVLDRPVVVTAFDAEDQLPWWQSTRRMLDYTHFRKLVELGGVRVVRSFADLTTAIHAYLADPSLDADGRAATRRAQCGPCDGRASERIADALAAIHRAARIRRLGYRFEQRPTVAVDTCNLCGAGEFTPIADHDRYGFEVGTVACTQCGLTVLSRRMTPDEQAHFYQAIYRPLVSAYHGRQIDHRTIQVEQQTYADELADAAGSWLAAARGGRLLDVGGSTGVVARHLAQTFGLRPTVLDPAPAEVHEAGAAGLETITARVDDWDARGIRYDVIGLFQTIDHLLDVRATLEHLRGALADDGLFLMDIVDFRHVVMKHRSIAEAAKIDHPYSLTESTAEAFLARAGFGVLHKTRSRDGHLVLYVCRPCAPDPGALPPPHEVSAFFDAMRRV